MAEALLIHEVQAHLRAFHQETSEVETDDQATKSGIRHLSSASPVDNLLLIDEGGH